MPQLVAFLRGINLGKRRIKMDDLRQCFERAECKNVRTLLASGNVLFDGENDAKTVQSIEKQIEIDFKFSSETILRSIIDLLKMAQSDPFDGVVEDKDTKLYVFFLGPDETQKLQLPMGIAGDFKVTRVTESEIFAIAWRKSNGRFSDNLLAVTKPFGRYVTNRNWTTILKLIALAKQLKGQS